MAAKQTQLLDGILLVDKATGMSSFAVVDAIRQGLREVAGPAPAGRRGRRDRWPKCGHAGTLDPMATGLLIVLIGRGVRLSRFLMGLDKDYQAVVRFGAGTDTHDREGQVTAQATVGADLKDLRAALIPWRGEVTQVPPIYSAIKRQGRPLYALARAGQEPAEPEPRSVRIERLELLQTRWGVAPTAAEPFAAELTATDGLVYEASLEVSCSSGTYLRSLARDLGRELGCPAHLHALRRSRIGPFAVTEALPADRLEVGTRARAALISLAQTLPHLPVLKISSQGARQIRNGVQPAREWLALGDEAIAESGQRCFQIHDADGGLVAVVEVAGAAGAVGAEHRLVVFPLPDSSEERNQCE